MSAASPSSSHSPPATSPPNASQEVAPTLNSVDQAIAEYLRARGHHDAEKAFLQEVVEGRTPDDKTKPPEEIGKDEFIRSLAVFAQKVTRPGENLLKDSGTVLQQLSSMGNPTAIQKLIASIGAIGSEEVISADPTDREEGFRELEAWVDGSLDMYRVCIVHRSVG